MWLKVGISLSLASDGVGSSIVSWCYGTYSDPLHMYQFTELSLLPLEVELIIIHVFKGKTGNIKKCKSFAGIHI